MKNVPIGEDVGDEEPHDDYDVDVDTDVEDGEDGIDSRDSDFAKNDYKVEDKEIVDNAVLSDYESNDYKEGYVTNSEDERPIA